MNPEDQLSRRGALQIAAGMGLALGLPHLARAQSFPSKPIHLVVPFTAGGSSDVLSRLVGQKLSQRWGQPVLVEPRPGGGTVIGSALVAKAPADGHTLLFISNSFVINAKLRKDMPYDGIRAFKPVANMANSPQVIAVHAASRYQTFMDLVDDARKRQGAVSIGSVGPTTAQHIAAEMLQRAVGAKMIYTAFTGGAPAVNAALGGHIDVVLASLADVAAHLEAGKLRPLAVTTSQRLEALRQVPTVSELGFKGYEALAWFGIAAPTGTPPDVIAKLADGLNAAVSDPEVRQRMAAFGLQPAFMNPKAFGDHIGQQFSRYSKVIDEANIKAE